MIWRRDLVCQLSNGAIGSPRHGWCPGLLAWGEGEMWPKGGCGGDKLDMARVQRKRPAGAVMGCSSTTATLGQSVSQFIY
jgi:hypothetical protein